VKSDHFLFVANAAKAISNFNTAAICRATEYNNLYFVLCILIFLYLYNRLRIRKFPKTAVGNLGKKKPISFPGYIAEPKPWELRDTGDDASLSLSIIIAVAWLQQLRVTVERTLWTYKYLIDT
jgi:hypothetical protein